MTTATANALYQSRRLRQLHGARLRSWEEATIAQRVGDKRFAVVVQLLEAPGGERLIRFAYTTDGTARRGPVTMRARDLERLRAALERAPVLRDTLCA